MSFEKIDEKNFKKIVETEKVYNIDQLKKEKIYFQSEIVKCNDSIDEIDLLLSEAEKLE